MTARILVCPDTLLLTPLATDFTNKKLLISERTKEQEKLRKKPSAVNVHLWNGPLQQRKVKVQKLGSYFHIQPSLFCPVGMCYKVLVHIYFHSF